MQRGRIALPFTSRRARSLRLLRPQRQTLSSVCPICSASPGRVGAAILHPSTHTHWCVVIVLAGTLSVSGNAQLRVVLQRAYAFFMVSCVGCVPTRLLSAQASAISRPSKRRYLSRCELTANLFTRLMILPCFMQGNAGLVNVSLPSLQSVGTLQISVRACVRASSACVPARSSS